MPKYTFEIRKADHLDLISGGDLHVHVYYSEGRSRRPLGRYRLPSLEPVFPRERQLNQAEINLLQNWLAQPPQIEKLRHCLKDTVFNLHKISADIPRHGNIIAEGGETFIMVKIPVAHRLD
jgi:hypothetical protein